VELYISIPLDLLAEKYLPYVLENKVNVEVGLPWYVLENFSYLKLREIAKKLKDSGINTTIHLPFIDLSPGALDPWIKEVSLRRIVLALERGSLFFPKNAVLHSGYHPDYHREHQKKWKEEFKDSLELILKAGEDYGVSISLENTFEPEPEFLEEFFETFKGRLGWCFDPAHARVFSKKDEISWLKKLHRFLKEVHCHDNHGEVDEHLAVGKGVIKFEEIFAFFKEKGLKPIITSEAHTEEDTYLNIERLTRLMEL